MGPGASAVGRWFCWDRCLWAPQVGPGAWGAVLRTLRVGGAFPRPRGAAPRGGPPARRGSPFLPRNGEKEGRGRCPLDPGVYGPLTLVRSFWGSLSLVRKWGCFLRYAKIDLGRIFEGKYVGKHVCERKVPTRCASTPQSLPLGGEGAPVRTLGRMRGRPGCPTGQEKKGVGAIGRSFYKERLGTGSPPHQSPSVTASPQGEASGLCYPTRKSVPNQGT